MLQKIDPNSDVWVRNQTLTAIAMLRTSHGDCSNRCVDQSLADTVVAAALRSTSAP